MLVAVSAWLIGFGAAAAYFAVQRRRNPVWWVGLGAILGPIALLILQRAPPGRCASCDARTVGWSALCAWCGEDVRGVPAEPPAEPASLPAPGVPAPTTLTVIRGARRDPNRPAVVATDSATDADAVPPTPDDSAALGPVRRLKSVLGAPAADGPASPLDSIATAPDPGEPREVILASAVYVTGTRGLQAGSRYGIALIGSNLGILGPVDVDPSAIVVLRQLHGLDATGEQGQLIITADESVRSNFALVFMSLAGGTPERVAEIIAAAASTGAIASR